MHSSPPALRRCHPQSAGRQPCQPVTLLSAQSSVPSRTWCCKSSIAGSSPRGSACPAYQLRSSCSIFLDTRSHSSSHTPASTDLGLDSPADWSHAHSWHLGRFCSPCCNSDTNSLNENTKGSLLLGKALQQHNDLATLHNSTQPGTFSVGPVRRVMLYAPAQRRCLILTT